MTTRTDTASRTLPDDKLDRNGSLVGSSDVDDATFQSVRMNTPAYPTSTPNGRFDIYVAYEGLCKTLA